MDIITFSSCARPHFCFLTNLVAVFERSWMLFPHLKMNMGILFLLWVPKSSYTSRARFIMFTKFAAGSSGGFKSPAPIPV
jgi:hypothetical protein